MSATRQDKGAPLSERIAVSGLMVCIDRSDVIMIVADKLSLVFG